MFAIFNKQLEKKERLRLLITYVIYFLFSVIMFSVPFFSFRENLNTITWIFTVLFVLLSSFYIIFYKKIHIDVIACSFIIFLILITVSSALSLFKNFSLSIYLNTLIILISYLYCKNDKNKIDYLLISAFIGIVLFSFTYFLQYFREIMSFNFDRLGDRFGDINDIGIILCLGSCIGCGMSFKYKKWYLKLIFLFLSLFTAFLSFTSGSKICLFLIAGIAFATIILVFGKRRWYFSLITISALILLLFVIINIPMFSMLKTRMHEMVYTFFGIGEPTSTSFSTLNRLDMFKGGMSLFLRRPVFGFGVNGYENFAGYPGKWSHNHISETFANFGILGTFFYHFPLVFSLLKTKGKQVNKNYILYLVFSFITMISTVLFREKFYTFIIGSVLAYIEIDDIYLLNIFSFLGKKRKKLTYGEN